MTWARRSTWPSRNTFNKLIKRQLLPIMPQRYYFESNFLIKNSGDRVIYLMRTILHFGRDQPGSAVTSERAEGGQAAGRVGRLQATLDHVHHAGADELDQHSAELWRQAQGTFGYFRQGKPFGKVVISSSFFRPKLEMDDGSHSTIELSNTIFALSQRPTHAFEPLAWHRYFQKSYQCIYFDSSASRFNPWRVRETFGRFGCQRRSMGQNR